MNKGKQIVLTSFVLLITAILVSGGTFAYWIWQSDPGDNTLINITFNEESQGIKMLINPVQAEKSGMYPTKNCGGDGAMMGNATVTIINNTGVTAKPKFKLKLKIEPASGRIVKAGHILSINYAVFDGKNTPCTSDANGVAQNTLATGGFPGGSIVDGWSHTSTYLKTGSTGTNWVTFEAPPYSTTTHEYTVWAWIDFIYNPGTYGQTNTTDTLQDANIIVTWSENSIVEQVDT